MIVAGSASPLLLASAAGGYNLTRSLRFRSSASAYLNRTPASASNRKTWTWSGWVKLGTLGVNKCLMEAGVVGLDTYTLLWIQDTGALRITQDEGGSATIILASNAVYRDPSAWYHIVYSVDTTQATDSNRVKIYVNGVQVTSLSSATYPPQNRDTYVDSTFQHRIGNRVRSSGMEFDGYMTEINFIDGQALTPSSFGATNASTGVWQPKKYAGTYGTNGFYLPFTDNSTTTTLGNDFSGNGNNWTTNNISLTAGSTYDSMTDVPTLTSATAANYCVINPLDAGSGATTSNGNLSVATGAPTASIRGTIGITSGKFYWECQATALGNGMAFGVFGANANLNDWTGIISGITYGNNGSKNINGSETSYGASYTTSDIIGVAVDADAGTVTFYKNNTSQGALSTIPNPCFASFTDGSGGASASGNINFGQRPFTYTPPTGFVALNTFNLPTPTIGATASTQANDYFNPVLYTGNGSTQSVTGLDFQPDWVWIKERSSSSQHALFDSVRGVQKRLVSDSTAAEDTSSTLLTAFNSNGFSVGSDGAINENGQTYVGWSWKANGSPVSNTAGTITSTVSANTSAGFSIATFTGTGSTGTIGHGLGVAPKMVIVKARTVGANPNPFWSVYHASTGANGIIFLNSTDAFSTNSAPWNNTAPTSSVFTVGNGNSTNYSGNTFVAYCFSEILGFSKAFSYTGNGSSDGSFVFCGFRPRWIMVKNSTGTGDWIVWDSARNTFNVTNSKLSPNTSGAEFTDTAAVGIDLLSNGFKIRGTDNAINASGASFIGFAIAENPFKYSLGR